MRNSRLKRRGTAQPYKRRRRRVQGPVLKAQKRGRTLYGKNPADRRRRMQRKRKAPANPLFRAYGMR